MSLAHIIKGDNIYKTQTIAEHCKGTSDYATVGSENIGIYYLSKLAGILHDMGKYSNAFQEYIKDAANGKQVKKGSVNHTFAAVIFLFDRYHTNREMINNKNEEYRNLTCEILAYAVGAHHGLFDIWNLNQDDGFLHRLTKSKKEIEYDAVVKNFFEKVISLNEIDTLFQKAVEEVKSICKRIAVSCVETKKQNNFMLGLFTRLITSKVINADRLDTTEFYAQRKIIQRNVDEKFWTRQQKYFDGKLSDLSSQSAINKARAYISNCCYESAKKVSGIYKLNVPTGAGKTLSALRYALEHAREYNKKRIIFIIPLLSILEQNAEIIREYVNDKDAVLEHHSNVIFETNDNEELNQYELLKTTWDAPIIISTLVQLLNCMFNDNTTDIRRFQSLVDSVIVIDEVQSIPKKMLEMCNTAFNFLAECCNSTIVLCSATQPCFEKMNIPIRFQKECDLVPYNEKIWKTFKRTNIVNKVNATGMSIKELAAFSQDIMCSESSLLVICNTKKSAAMLFDELKQSPKYGEYKLHYLSTAMCIQHRKNVLKIINEEIKTEKVICVSTQLIEAGVDISFKSVIRVYAGLDNIAQAAGRCNRNGESEEPKNVYVVKLNAEYEKLTMLKDIQKAQKAFTDFYVSYEDDESKFKNDMLSEESIALYYNKLFKDIEEEVSYPFKLQGMTFNLYQCLAGNKKLIKEDKYLLNQSFKTAAEIFKVFEENTLDVIVPYDERARELINRIDSMYECSEDYFNYEELNQIVQEIKPYLVSVYDNEYRKLLDSGKVYQKSEFRILQSGYSTETGIDTSDYDVKDFMF